MDIKFSSQLNKRLNKAYIIICLLDMISQLELDKPEERRKPKKSVNGVFWIILLNLGLYVADHVFQVIKN